MTLAGGICEPLLTCSSCCCSSPNVGLNNTLFIIRYIQAYIQKILLAIGSDGKHSAYIEGSAQDYANSLFFTNSLFCSFEKLMVKYTFCETTKFHVCAKGVFIHNLKVD